MLGTMCRFMPSKRNIDTTSSLQMTKQGGSPFSPAIQLNEAVVAHVARRKAETIGTSHLFVAHSSTTASAQRTSIGADTPPRLTPHKQLQFRATTSLSPQQFFIGVLTAATHADSTRVQTGKLREQYKETNRQSAHPHCSTQGSLATTHPMTSMFPLQPGLLVLVVLVNWLCCF